jgi:hypothetical protein
MLLPPPQEPLIVTEAYSRSPAASRAYRLTSLIFLSSVFGVPPSGV